MARFYGTLQGTRGPASRLGHSHLQVTAQSYQGDIQVVFSRGEEAKGDDPIDWVQIHANGHGERGGVCLYNGPVAKLLTYEGRDAIVQAFAHDALERENRRAK